MVHHLELKELLAPLGKLYEVLDFGAGRTI